MTPLRKLAFLTEEFGQGLPVQQLLDRFLIGYPLDGKARHPLARTISIYSEKKRAENALFKRAETFKLQLASNPKGALQDANAVIVACRQPGGAANFLKSILETSAPGTPIFFYGLVSQNLQEARQFRMEAVTRKLKILSGTYLPVTWRFPEISLPFGIPLSEALVVVQGSFPQAEFDAMEAFFPLIEKRKGGEVGVEAIRRFDGRRLWSAGKAGAWSEPLLKAAISRSDSPQGDALVDGRTQDLIRLGLLPKLAKSPRGWQIQHRDGLKSTILVLDGVTTDYNVAIRLRNGDILSTQIFRAPPPAEHHFSLLCSAIEPFLRGAAAPWSANRSDLITALLERFAKHAEKS